MSYCFKTPSAISMGICIYHSSHIGEENKYNSALNMTSIWCSVRECRIKYLLTCWMLLILLNRFAEYTRVWYNVVTPAKFHLKVAREYNVSLIDRLSDLCLNLTLRMNFALYLV